MTENPETSADLRKLWIGNLDSRITEFQLLKILQKFGEIEKFDLLFHRTGPLAGQPRGYAFVTYKEIKDTNNVLDKLNGKKIGTKYVSVRLSKSVNYDEFDRPKPVIEIPVLTAGSSSSSGNTNSVISSNNSSNNNVGGKKSCGQISKEIAIQAIEAKLKLLEKQDLSEDFEINKTVTNETPIIKKYQYNQQQVQKQTTKLITKSRHKSNPYGGSGRNTYYKR